MGVPTLPPRQWAQLKAQPGRRQTLAFAPLASQVPNALLVVPCNCARLCLLHRAWWRQLESGCEWKSEGQEEARARFALLCQALASLAAQPNSAPAAKQHSPGAAACGVPCVKSGLNELAKIVKLALPLLATPGAYGGPGPPSPPRGVCREGAPLLPWRPLPRAPQCPATYCWHYTRGGPTFHEIVKSGDNPDSRRLPCKFLSG